MSTANEIDRYISSLPQGKLFTRGDLLDLGSAGAVDACLYRMVKGGEIIRWAWGVFMRAEETDNRVPSAFEIATVKAKRFGKKIAQHGLDAAHALGLTDEGNPTPTYLACSRNTSFLFAKRTRIRIRGTVPRKLLLLDQFGESVVKALWHLGENSVTVELVRKLIDKFTPTEKKQVRAMRGKMPSWMSDSLVLLWQAQPA